MSRQRLVGRTNGSSAYLLDLAEAVRAAGLEPHLVQPSPVIFGRMPILRLKPAMKLFASHAVRGALRLGDTLIVLNPRVYLAAAIGVIAGVARRAGISADWARDRKLPHAISTPWTEADYAFVRRTVNPDDIVLADYMFQIEGLTALPAPPRASAIVMHDLYHTRTQSAARLGADDSIGAISVEEEAACFARADAVIAIQENEADFVRRAVPGVAAILAPMSYATHATPQPGEDDRILFVGSNTPPNVIGLQWLFDHVWPLVRTARPAARLDIAGTVARGIAAPSPQGVQFLGLVDDLDTLYAGAGVVISPLTYGSGLKVKLIEALAQGKAIVATGITLQGVEAIAGEAVRAANAPEEFAAAIADLCADPTARATLAKRALDVAEAHFSPRAAHAEFINWLTRKAAWRRGVAMGESLPQTPHRRTTGFAGRDG